jgi:glycosyltransferase involved in cell wall biosynthesis
MKIRKGKAKSSTPLVSVVMPVYNAGKYLPQAIESILNQTYKNFEFIIVDDCSTDNSKKILLEYAKKDKRIKLIFNKKNSGVAFNYDRAIRLAKGEFIAAMESDDISSNYRLEKQIKALLESKDLCLVGSDIFIINENNKIVAKRIYPHSDFDIRKMIIFKSPFAQPSVMFRRKVYLKTNGYDKKYKNAMDYDLWFRFINYGKVLNLAEPLLYYRVHANQSKSKSLKNQLKETIIIQKKYIFKKDYFSIYAFLNFIGLNLLYILPNFVILYLFKLKEFKKLV